jgi:hypothetical protein
VFAGEHDYGRQLDGQLRIAGLPRADDPAGADLVVVAGLAGEPEVDRARALAPLPVIGFDGLQGADLGAGRAIDVALPFGPGSKRVGVEESRRAAQLVVAALRRGAGARAAVLDAMRRLGPFDEHGDPVEPVVWLWRAAADWALTAGRAL